MTWLEALILGIIQGLTEFLPVSSSGHLEIGKALLGTEAKENMLFTVIVHGATVLSTIVVFRKTILQLVKGVLKFKYNEEMEYFFLIVVSMLPVLVVGLFFKDEVESFFDGNLLFVGAMLILTGALLAFTYFSKPKEKNINYKSAFIIGIAQAIAVLPGISRSGSTIAVALLAGINKEKAAKFSFLMVLPPILGANLLTVKDIFEQPASTGNISATVLIVGFLAAFLAGIAACTWMINIVKKGKLIWFAIYCVLAGLIAVTYSLFF